MTTTKALDGTIRVGEAIARVLEEAEIDMIFGIIGGDSWMLFDALNEHTDTVRAVLVREESLAGVMAEVYGRLTGRPGVVYGQGAWIIANALLGTLEAHLSSSPMLLLADLTDGGHLSHHGSYQTGAGDYGGFDARQALGGVVKRVMVAHNGPQAVQSVQLAIKHALAGERGPIAVLFSSSALRTKVGPDAHPVIYPTRRYLTEQRAVPTDAELRQFLDTLRDARRPVIIAGNGVRISNAYPQLQRLAERYAMPVATSGGGKGVFPEVHELALGVCGTFGRPIANAVVGQADLLLVLGSRLAPPDTANENPLLVDPGRQTIIQLDIEPRNASWTFPADQTLIGDVRATLDRLLALDIDAPNPTALEPRHRVLHEARAMHGWFDVDASYSDDVPLLPERIVKLLNTTLPDDAMVTCDAGENRLFMMHLFQTKRAGNYLQSAGIGGMGYAIPAALAAKLVDRSRPVVAVCGDGGFGMSMNGLLTALEQDIPIVVVVLNNAALGWVYNGLGKRQITAELGHYDYAAISRAMGCGGTRVETSEQLTAALEEALADHGRPWVIDVVTALDEKHSFLQVTSPLAR
ncbi:thiamine pyrophosphate-binding protein [Dactylosporangium sp. NPDC005572]|uniref:thiamine pyrophosphate-binding protein n=1 Tax=Dactylosporangium sp. NPDC005572 TaxID=3156889 RepID=UPI0033B75B2C